MRPRLGSSAFLWVITAGLTASLVALAILQYRWIGQVSEAERGRIRTSLNFAASQFRTEFNRELSRICSSVHVDTRTIEEKDWHRFGQVLDSSQIRLQSSSPLVANLLVFALEGAESNLLLQMDFASQRFEQIPWPSHLQPLRELLSRRGPFGRRPPPDARVIPWALFLRFRTVVHPILVPRSVQPDRRAEARLLGFVMVELDEEALRDEFLPELAQRCFGGPAGLVYQAAVIEESAGMVYQTHPQNPPQIWDSADVRLNLLPAQFDGMGRFPPGPGRGAGTGDNEGRTFGGPPRRFGRRGGPPGGFRTAMVVPGEETGNWVLAVRPIQGSLDDIVAGLRRRSLLVSFGILLLLAASVGVLVAAAQRSKRLAELHLNFAAGVSHELRTPLAVIHSAAENLADGVVKNSEPQIRQYGELIRNESRRLSETVEQALQFARGRSARPTLELRPVVVADVIDAAVSDLEGLIRAEGFTVEKNLAPDTPAVSGDFEALRQCLRNLLSNAIKYSGASRRIIIHSEKESSRRRDVIRIRVEDFGVGIDRHDLPYVFDPFYRSRSATSGQIKGTGLGLSLARDLVEEMGGRITARSEPGRGCVFTLFLTVPLATPQP